MGCQGLQAHQAHQGEKVTEDQQGPQDVEVTVSMVYLDIVERKEIVV